MCFFCDMWQSIPTIVLKRIKGGAEIQLSFPSVDGVTTDTADRFLVHLSAIESSENPVTFEA